MALWKFEQGLDSCTLTHLYALRQICTHWCQDNWSSQNDSINRSGTIICRYQPYGINKHRVIMCSLDTCFIKKSLKSETVCKLFEQQSQKSVSKLQPPGHLCKIRRNSLKAFVRYCVGENEMDMKIDFRVFLRYCVLKNGPDNPKVWSHNKRAAPQSSFF